MIVHELRAVGKSVLLLTRFFLIHYYPDILINIHKRIDFSFFFSKIDVMLIRRETRLFAHSFIRCIKLCHNRTNEQLDNLSCVSLCKYILFINDDDDERTKTYDNQLMKIHRYKICNKSKNTHTHR